MKLAAKIVLLACIALTLALCAFADSDPWADGASASSKSKKKGAPGSTEDDTMHANGEEDEEPPGFIERHAMVIMYVVIMAVNKLIRSFLAKKEQGASGEPGGLVKAVHSEAEWKEFVEESKRTNQLAIVDFSAAWCGPCKAIAPLYEQLSLKFSTTRFLKVDCDEVKVLGRVFDISAYPTFIVFRGAEKLGETTGADLKRVEELLKKHGAKEAR